MHDSTRPSAAGGERPLLGQTSGYVRALRPAAGHCSASSPSREASGTPAFATHSVVNKEERIEVVLRYHAGQPRMVRRPEDPLPIRGEVVARRYIGTSVRN